MLCVFHTPRVDFPSAWKVERFVVSFISTPRVVELSCHGCLVLGIIDQPFSAPQWLKSRDRISMLPADQWGLCFWLFATVEGTRTPVLLWSSSTKTDRRSWLQTLRDWLVTVVTHGGTNERLRWLEPVVHCLSLTLDQTVGPCSVNALRAAFEVTPAWGRPGMAWSPQSLASLSQEHHQLNNAAAEVAADLHQLANEDAELWIGYLMRSLLGLCHDIDWIMSAQQPPSPPARGSSEISDAGYSCNVRPRFS